MSLLTEATSLVLIKICLALLSLLAPLAALSESVDLQTLIAEVRSLRAAVDRTTQLALRLQLLIHRFHQQQQNVREVASAHERVKSELTWEERDMQTEQSNLEAMEASLRDSNDPRQKALLQGQLEERKNRMREYPRWSAERRAKESELGAKRRNEEIKLQEIERQLEQVEAMLASR